MLITTANMQDATIVLGDAEGNHAETSGTAHAYATNVPMMIENSTCWVVAQSVGRCSRRALAAFDHRVEEGLVSLGFERKSANAAKECCK